MNYSFEDILKVLPHNKSFSCETSIIINTICIDSRKVFSPKSSLFVALHGKLSDGHIYINDAYRQGIRNFLIREYSFVEKYNDINAIVVDDVLASLQLLAKHHRSQFDIPVIGITGSNGKTIIKEWLYQMLFDQYAVVKSPKSYNSQVGVPLSLLNMEAKHSLGIFEAGISQTGEMAQHSDMIIPTIGTFTNIGDAHNAGFTSREEKIREKCLLFAAANVILYCEEHTEIKSILQQTYPNKQLIGWSISEENVWLSNFKYQDKASKENMMHCIALMQYLGFSKSFISERINTVEGIDMRLQMKNGLYNCVIVNDVYSADLNALKIALEFLTDHSGSRQKLMFISALEQSAMNERDTLDIIHEFAQQHDIQEVHYLSESTLELPDQFYQYASKKELLDSLPFIDIANKAILVKGARSAGLESIVHRLSFKGHSTQLTINLTALEHNIRTYQSLLNSQTGIIAVIKAGAYGSGSAQVAQILHQNGIRYLAVAFVDEAVHLRNQGVTMPIIVFNSDLMNLRDVIMHKLELEVYTLQQLISINSYSKKSNATIRIHLKIDTGMHRLGFLQSELDELIQTLKDCHHIEVVSVFSHLASSEAPEDDDYTKGQFSDFDLCYEKICSQLSIRPMRHILNSSGITRFPQHQYEMVRLGLGLYGIDGGNKINRSLQKVHSLSSSILQIKQLQKGDSVGYNRNTILQKDTTVGIVNIGYADGLFRNVGNRKYSVFIDNKEAPILGNVSMDLIIVDLSNVPMAFIGDRVTVFDQHHTIEKLAEISGTIPYEILSRISERVQRVFVRL